MYVTIKYVDIIIKEFYSDTIVYYYYLLQSEMTCVIVHGSDQSWLKLRTRH